jgi:hypothetical protein
MSTSRHDDIQNSDGSRHPDDDIRHRTPEPLFSYGSRQIDDNSCTVDSRVRAALADAAHPVAMPAEVAARIRARLTEEIAASPGSGTGGTGTGGGPDGGTDGGTDAGTVPGAGRPAARPAPRRPTRFRARSRSRRAVVLLAAAAVVGTLVAAPVVLRPAPAPVRVAGDTPQELRRAAAGPGPLVDPRWARACLRAAGAATPEAPLLGSRPHTVAGQPGVLLVLGTGRAGRYRLVVVPADCGPGTARVLAETVTG